MDECKPLDTGIFSNIAHGVGKYGGKWQKYNGAAAVGRGLHSSNCQLNLSRF